MTNVEVLPTGDLISDTALEMSKLSKEDAAKMFKGLLENIDFNYFKIGGVLYTMKLNGWYVGDYSEYVENVMGIRAAKGYYLTSIYENLVKSGLQWEEVKQIGWSKMRVIAKFLSEATRDEQSEWLHKAEHMTHVQLQANVKALKSGESYTNAEEVSSKIKTITLKLYEDQLPTAEAAIRKAKEELGTESDIQAIDLIMQSYISDNINVLVTEDFVKEQFLKLGFQNVLNLMEEIFPEAAKL